ncbi:hypothetical protein BDE02_03G108700 [Populus trichocarpa]|nr:hypothetical protein BDE02_03G108700 [Populus trichocarpa]
MVFYLICHLAFACRSLPQSTDSHVCTCRKPKSHHIGSSDHIHAWSIFSFYLSHNLFPQLKSRLVDSIHNFVNFTCVNARKKRGRT